MSFFRSIKFRLTIWYLLGIMALLLVFGGTAYFMLSRSLYQGLDSSLQARVTEIQFSTEEAGNDRRGRGGGGDDDREDIRVTFVERLNEMVRVYRADRNLEERFGANVDVGNIDRIVQQALGGTVGFSTSLTPDGQSIRLYAAPFSNAFNARVIVIGRPTADITTALNAFRQVLIFSGGAVILLAALGGVLLADRVLRPVDRITRTARDIGERDLSRRIDVQTTDELGRLAATLNNMIERLEVAFGRQRQFTADASHELRTPLAVIQAESTLALEKERTTGEYRKSLELVVQETEYMSSIIGKLLFLARSDAGKEPLSIEPVNLKGMLQEMGADVQALAREKDLQLNMEQLQDATIRGDRVKLRQLFLNILQNAVRYTPAGGRITASLARKDKTAVVSISDTGIGIAPEHLPHIFERFYRVDKARSRAEGGAGLGLAIARQIAEAHGGKIEVESQAGRGSTFRVSLPLNSS
ncbi:MAG: HAMP domain-containing protein [Chloroflexi bacterium]|nr:HAMP domain-containing protein [Chloroflexota bacterium]